ncbi:MAG: hypothetical protein SFU98_01890 [Leptospiraceae bacterium]|nr:hypothetical protein [Leptospiraceae bacterium]
MKYILLLTLFTIQILSQDNSIPKIDASSGKIDWYDGDEKRTAHILSGYIAEFTSGNSTIKSFDSKANTVGTSSTMMIHKVSDSSIKSSLSKGLLPSSIASTNKFSHVFSETGDESRLMIPQNVIVKFKKPTNESEARSFLYINHFNVIQVLKFASGNQYVIETAPGIQTLEIANFVRSLEGIASASPDWMKQVSKR